MKKEPSLVSIDFWNTLVKGKTNGRERHHIRIKAIQKFARQQGKEIPEDRIIRAFSHVSEVFDEIWLGQQRTLTCPELLKIVADRLSLSFSEEEFASLEETFEQSLLEAPPELADGVSKAVPILAQNHTLAVISDTMYTSGRTLRNYLKQKELADYFDSFVFSDETGYSKPNVKAFQTVMKSAGAVPENSTHIGDMEQTDIAGACNAGMQAILYTGVSGRSTENHHAHAVFSHWDDIVAYLTE